jgi:hypothetical protein
MFVGCWLVCDSQQKLKKKKKIKAIKGKARLQTQEAEQSAVQNTWKAFVTKVSGIFCYLPCSGCLLACY